MKDNKYQVELDFFYCAPTKRIVIVIMLSSSAADIINIADARMQYKSGYATPFTHQKRKVMPLKALLDKANNAREQLFDSEGGFHLRFQVFPLIRHSTTLYYKKIHPRCSLIR